MNSPLRSGSARASHRTMLLLAGAAAIALAASGCGSSSSKTDSSTAASPNTSESAGSTGSSKPTVAAAQKVVDQYRAEVKEYPSPGTPLNGQKVAALRGKTVLYVPLGIGYGPFQQQQASMKAAFEHLGMKLAVCDPNFQPSAAATCLTNAKANGAAAVVTSVVPYSLAPNAYQALVAAKIPVLVGSAGPDSPPSTPDIAFQKGVTSANKAAAVTADTLIAQSNGTANVMFIPLTDSPASAETGRAMKAELEANCPGCKVTPVPFNTANLSKVASSVSSKLVSNPSTNYILPQADAYIPNVLSGVQNAGRTGKVNAVTFSATLGILQMVQNRQFVTADVGYDFSYIGWNEANGVLRMLTGLPVEAEPFVPIRVFDAKNLQGKALAPGSDIDSLYGPSSFKDAFYKNWSGQ